MEQEEILRRVDQASRADRWNQFVDIVEPLEEAIDRSNADPTGEVNAPRNIAQALIQSAELPDLRGTAATRRDVLVPDLFSKLKSADALSIAIDYTAQRWLPGASPQRDRWEATIASIARQVQPPDPSRYNDAIAGIVRHSQRRRAVSLNFGPSGEFIAVSNGDAYYCSSDTPLSAGDVVLRDMSLLGLRSFGHAGIFIGTKLNDPSSDDHKLYVVEMQATSGCGITTLANFKASAGGPGYWGCYSAGLNQLQRSSIVTLALSYVGVATYGICAYKDPLAPRFRCDGLVEHCYESLGPNLPATLSYRGGLFEDDRWNTLTPAALRSCCFSKTP